MCERAFVISKMQLDQQLPKGDVNYAFVTSFLHCWEYKYFIFKLHLQIKIHFILKIAITASLSLKRLFSAKVSFKYYSLTFPPGSCE